MSRPTHSNAQSPDYERWKQKQIKIHLQSNHKKSCFFIEKQFNYVCENFDCDVFEHCSICQSQSCLLLQTLLHQTIRILLTDGRIVEGEIECIDSNGAMILKHVKQLIPNDNEIIEVECASVLIDSKICKKIEVETRSKLRHILNNG